MRPLLASCLILLLLLMAGWALFGRLSRDGDDSPIQPAEGHEGAAPPSKPASPQLVGRQDDPARPPQAKEEPKKPVEESIWGEKIEFRVVDKVTQKPIEGALVRATVMYPEHLESHADGLMRQASTNAQGKARLARLEGGAGYAIRRVGYRVYWNDSKVPTMPIQLQASASLRGRVVDMAGSPIAGARVYAGSWPSNWFHRVDLVQFADEEGRFTITGVERGDAGRLCISHPGYGCVRLDYKGDTLQEQVITLGEGALVTGRVVSPEGSGVPAAEVFLGDRDVYELLRLDGWELERRAHLIMRTVTDAQGWFEFRGLSAPSEHVVCARTGDGREGETARFALADSETRREVLVHVHDVGSISVSFVEADTGNRIGEQYVTCTLDSLQGEAEGRHRTRGDRRLYRARLCGIQPGTHRLYAQMYIFSGSSELLTPPPVEVVVRAGQETHVEVVFERGRTVKGRVVDEDGQERNAMVRFESSWRGVKQVTETIAYGDFVLTAVLPAKGRLTLIDMNNDEERVWEEIELGAALEALVLPRGPYFLGRLPPGIDPKELRILVEEENGLIWFSYPRVWYRDDGYEFRIHDLPAHRAVNLYIRAPGRAAVILRDVVLRPGEIRDLGLITCPAGKPLQGRVLDSSGEPVVGAIVQGLEPHAPGRANTDSEGHFRLSRLADLPTTFGVWADELPLGFIPVDVRAELSSVTLRLPKPGRLRARFRLLNDEPLAATKVGFTLLTKEGVAQRGALARLLTNGYGLVEADLPPGTWMPSLLGSGGDKISGTRPQIVIQSGKTTEVEIRVR